MTSVAAEFEGPSAAPATEPPSEPMAPANNPQRLLLLHRLLSRRLPPALALSTAVICSAVTQHPVVVLILMLCFPATLVALEQVEQRLRAARRTAQSAQAESAMHLIGSCSSELEAADMPLGKPEVEPAGPAPVPQAVSGNAESAAA